MVLSASPRAALLPLPHRLPRCSPAISPATPPVASHLTSCSDQGFGRLGASFVARAKDTDDGRATAAEKFAAPPPKPKGFSYGEGFGKETSKVEDEQGESSSWNVLNQISVERIVGGIICGALYAISVMKCLSAAEGKLDSDYAYTILIYGTSALVALWISAVIVSALDSIPLVPKMMEVVGLGFTVWFTSRYLIFKDNRDELLTRIYSIKKQILGSGDD